MVKADVKHSMSQRHVSRSKASTDVLASSQITMPISNYQALRRLRMFGKLTESWHCSIIRIAIPAEKRSVYPSFRQYKQQ